MRYLNFFGPHDLRLGQVWSVANDQHHPASSRGDGDVGDHGSLLADHERLPSGMQPPVAGVWPGHDRGRCALPTGQDRGPGLAVGRAVMPGSVDQQPTGVGVARLVIDPCTREAPEECLLGTSPR